MGDITMDLVLVGAVGLGLYFAYKGLSGLFTSTKSEVNNANNAAIQTSTAAANQATAQQVAASGQKPTLLASTINGLVNTIVTAMNSDGNYPWDDLNGNIPALTGAVDSVNNTADWVALTQAFGTKELLTGQSVDLLTALSIVLSEDTKANLNSYFVNMNIGAPNYILIP